MAETLKLGNGEWATKENSLLSYNDENGNYKPLPFDFTRASSATVVNKAGLIETVQSGIPRIDFLGNTNGSLLLEPQRTNNINYSEPTSSETSAGGITYESFNWSLGFTNCIKFGDNSQSRYRYFTGTVANSTEYTISAFVIMDDLSEPVLGINSTTGDLVFRVGGTTATTGNLPNVNMGNNIYRVSSVITSDAGGGSTGLLKYSEASNKGFRVVGFQLEQSSYPTSYIPTQGSTVTRVAEICNNGGNDQVINSTEGVLYAEISSFVNTDSYRLISLNNGDSSNSIFFGLRADTGNIYFFIQKDGVTQMQNISSVSALNSMTKIALKYKQNDCSCWINGVQIGSTDTSVNLPIGLNSLDMDFGNVTGSYPFYGNTKDLRVYNTALTDAELQALTTI